MKRISAAIMMTACVLFAGTAGAAGDSLALALRQIQADTEESIQSKIVDPVLGKGNAYVFAEMSMDLVLRETGQSREGVGLLSKSVSTETATRQGAGAEGKENPKGFSFGDEPDPAAKAAADKNQNAEEPMKAAAGTPERVVQSQTSQQEKKDLDQRLSAELEVKSFSLRILHNSGISKEKLAALSRTILALYPKVVKGQADMTITFVPAPFAKGGDTWMEKLAK